MLTWHIAKVAFQDLPSTLYVRVRNHDMSVKSSWPHQGFVQGLWEISRCHDYNAIAGFESTGMMTLDSQLLL